MTDALGNKVGYQYDARSFRFQEDRALGAITRFTPTAMADVAEVLDAEGRRTVNTYDFRRRLERVANGADELTKYGYDLNGNRTSVLKPKGAGFFQSFEYDAANRLVKVTTPAGASELTYDLHGNLTRKKDALNHSTAYSDFDARNRRRLTTFADTKTEATTYDGVGNVKTLRDSNGATTTYTYDERHRERFKRYWASVDGLTEIETTYDGVGNVKTTKETYGAATRLHQRDYDAFNRLEREVDAWNDEVRHTYDLQGNRKTTTAQGATTLYGYDELNRRKSVTTAAGVTELEYDRTNLPTAVRYPNGVVSTTTYDRAMRVETVKHAKGATVLESVGHTYDLDGNRKTQSRVAGPVTENTTYDYDFDDWLTGTTVTKTDGAGTSSQAIVYTLDAVGNRKREDSTATGPDAAAKTYAKVFTVDERDRVRNVATTGAGAGTSAYVYDDNGNLISKSGAAGSKTYVWNERDRLVEVRDGATPIARYKYNAEGLRDEVEGERRTTWVNGFAYLDKTPAGGLLAKYETHPNGRSPILAVSPSGTEFLHSDALGSSTLSTNNAGTTNATTTYDEWGNSITTGATINKFGYTGHETDANTGLVYFKARHYDPELGKFISADSFEGTPNYPVTWNSYLYTNGNPLIYIDAQGNVAELVNFSKGLGEFDDSLREQTKDYFGWERAGLLPNSVLRAGTQLLKTGVDLLNIVANKEIVQSPLVGDQRREESAAELTKTIESVRRVGEVLSTGQGWGMVTDKIATKVVSTAKGAASGDAAAQSDVLTALTDVFTVGKAPAAIPKLVNEMVEATADAVKGMHKLGDALKDGLSRSRAHAEDMFTAEGGFMGTSGQPGTVVRGAEPAISKATGGYGRFGSADEFASEAFARYQRYTNEEYSAALRAEQRGRLTIPEGMSRETIVGQRTDAFARARMERWLKKEGVAEGPGEAIQLNRWLRDPAGSGSYRIPDVRIPEANLIMDGTIGYKWQTTPQVADFHQFSDKSHVTIVRPTELGGSYSLIPPK